MLVELILALHDFRLPWLVNDGVTLPDDVWTAILPKDTDEVAGRCLQFFAL